MKKIICLFATSFFISHSHANKLDNDYLNLSNMVDIDRYSNNLKMIAIPRSSGTENHRLIREELIKRLKDLSYDVTQHNYGTGVNIIGRKLGKKLPNEEIIISAHYDSRNDSTTLAECDGADDNASGVAGAIEVATILAHSTFDRTLTIIFWDEEERNYLGSKSYLPQFINGDIKTKLMFSMEMIGFTNNQENTQKIPFGFDLVFPAQYNQIKSNSFRSNFIAVAIDDSEIAQLSGHLMEQRAQIENLPMVTFQLSNPQKNSPLFHDMARSDHASFWTYDIPAMMVSDTGDLRNTNYHCENNTPDPFDSIDYDFATKVVKTITYTAVHLLKLSR